ncbi:hypothetical protein [Flavobacterium gilvum]|uniref:Uncharacterized protein n=1 Tax=Flavobacterium gilvum TaxID=1492737 RepID=A0AAC9I1J5_9FLAO|nr:hypothetical protein [Flavobacterium gilvum]AOW08724.1 hypothetical protein EM308_03980 [Flavobacterium gilvum]KFC59837.1 hypothetical protein FEM08_13480 [Flavobacterium gilvum]
MSETLTVPKDKVLAAYSKAKSPRKVMLENLFGAKTFQPEIKERIKNLSDVIRENGISEKEFRESCEGLEPDEVAYKMVKEIVKAFNEGWTPDWTNSNQGKYYPWFKMGSPSGGGFSFFGYDYWLANSLVGSRLCYKSADLAKHAGQLFESIYKDFLTA